MSLQTRGKTLLVSPVWKARHVGQKVSRRDEREIKRVTSSIANSAFALSRNREPPKPSYGSGSPLETLGVLTAGDS